MTCEECWPDRCDCITPSPIQCQQTVKRRRKSDAPRQCKRRATFSGDLVAYCHQHWSRLLNATV